MLLLKESYLKADERPQVLNIKYLSWEFEVDLSNFKISNIFEIYLDLKKIDLDYFNLTPKWVKKGNKLIQLNEDGNIIEKGVYRKVNR